MHRKNSTNEKSQMHMNGYISILIMIAASFALTYFLLMTILVPFSNRTNNVNKFYAALIMGTTMGAVEAFMMLLSMPRNDPKRFGFWMTAAILVFASLIIYLFILNQVGVTQIEFIKSMIEHHEMAITMSNKVKPKVQNKELCGLVQNIISSQQSEIDQMKHLLTLPCSNFKTPMIC